MKEAFQPGGRIPKGIDISEPVLSGPVVETCVSTSVDGEEVVSLSSEKELSWCYVFIHHAKVSAFTEKLEYDGVNYFIHRSIVYQRGKYSRGVRAVEKNTVSGLVFLQGMPRQLQQYLDEQFPGCHLVNDCATRLPAVIADTVMQPFMRVLDTSPERVRFLLKPFHHYAGGNVKLRITSGFLAGLEGYVIRIDRDRRLVMNVGGMSVAISGIHCEKFEVVERKTIEK